LPIRKSKDAPQLEFHIAKVPKHVKGVYIATTLTEFLRQFQEFYNDEVSSLLFDDLAWKCMKRSLTLSKIGDKYAKQIMLQKYGNRNWKMVVECLETILDLDEIKADLRTKLYGVKPLDNESASVYADRIEVLLKASGCNEYNVELIHNIMTSLPDTGREKFKEHFKSVEAIGSVSTLLSFLQANPSLVD
ncbi:hypothetical protein BGZ76_007977, partial [Entomortierella beljakovae]